MFSEADVRHIRSVIENLLHAPLPAADIRCQSGLTVTFREGRAAVAAENRNALSRGLFLLGLKCRQGQQEFHFTQQRHFPSCGIMLDVSRGAVMTVDAVKRLLDRLAAAGLNLLLLYMEDVYTVPEYPYFGYLRGRYTADELREIDAYAASLDIEVVPCIQTLGHMEQFLQWDAQAEMRDTPDILLADEPETRRFLEAAIAALRSCLHTKRIHIGMDEAYLVGLGRWREKHGDPDRFALLNRHLSLVCEICRSNGFRPMMWSDMFFRLGSSRGDYYDPEAYIPPEAAAGIPDVGLCYWDYYHMDEAFYDHMLEEHAKLGSTVFAGGIWTWSGFLPQVQRTEATMRPALRACLRHRPETVFATMWGDDGAETNPFLALPQLPLFSESCWGGEVPDPETVDTLGEALTGIPASAFHAFGRFYPSERDRRTGKALIWGDPLYPLAEYGFETPEETAARCREALAVLTDGPDFPERAYAAACFRTAALKGEMIVRLRAAYRSGDGDALRSIAEEQLPAIADATQSLMEAHRALWHRDMKRNGWEVFALRYGGVTARLEDVRREILDYLTGGISSIPELDEAPLNAGRIIGQHFAALAIPYRRI